MAHYECLCAFLFGNHQPKVDDILSLIMYALSRKVVLFIDNRKQNLEIKMGQGSCDTTHIIGLKPLNVNCFL